MQLVLHAGSHFTEESRVLKCLLRNKEALRAQGTIVPGPGRYKGLLRDTVVAMKDTKPSPEARALLLEAITDNQDTDRVVLSHPHLFAWPRAAIRLGLFYPLAAERFARLSYIFADDELELFMAVRNPATFIPKCFERNPRETLEAYFAGSDPRDLRWSDTFELIRDAVPDVPITVWCSEDTPLLWSQIIREIGGLDHNDPIVGQFDLVRELMSREGSDRFLEYLENHPDLTEIHSRRVVSAFLERYALEEKIQEEIDLPGMTFELVTDLTEIYEEDVADIARIPGVTMMTL